MLFNLFKKNKTSDQIHDQSGSADLIPGSYMKKVGANYLTDSAYIEYMSSLTVPEVNKMIGKKISFVSAEKNRVTLTLESDSGPIQVVFEGMTIDHEGKVDSLDVKVIDNIIKL